VEPIVPMVQTGTVRVRVLAPDGKPVTGSHITDIWPEGDPMEK